MILFHLVVIICHLLFAYSYVCKNTADSAPFRKVSLLKHRFSSKLDHLSGHSLSTLSKNGYSKILSELKFKVSDAEPEVLVEEEEEEAIESTGRDIGAQSVNAGGLLQRLSKGIVPIAASIGFAATPSSSLIFRLAGATVGGFTGILAKRFVLDKYLQQRLDDDTPEENYTPEIARALRQLTSDPEILSYTIADVEAVAKQNDIKASDLSVLFTYLFSDMLIAATKDVDRDLTELVDILDFAVNLDLKPSEIGDGFALAAIKIGKQLKVDERGFFSAEYPQELLLQASKLFFLGEKLIGAFEGFYGKRFATALYVQFPQESFNEVITASCKVLFKRCIESVLANPESFTPDEVNTLREYITTSPEISSFRPSNMQNMILEAVQLSVDSTLGKSGVRSAELTNYKNLRLAQKVLGWNSLELESTIETRTLPLFEKAVRDAINDIFQHPDRAMNYEGFFEERMKSLCIDPMKAKVTLTTIISEKNKEYLTTIDKVYSIAKGSLEPTYKLMIKYARTYDELKRLTKFVMNDTKLPIPGLPFADLIRANLYELKITSTKSANSKYRESSNLIEDEMFALSDVQQELVKKSIALPKVTTWILQCLQEGNYDASAKDAYQKLLIEYSVSKQEWAQSAIDFYYQQVQEIASSKAVPSNADLEKLQKIRAFLDIAKDDERSKELVSKVHLELFGEKYTKALNECMTPTGVIVEEYVDSLNRLRERLGLTEADARLLLSFSVRTRMTSIIKGLLEQYKSSQDPTKLMEKRQKRMKAKQADPISSLDNKFGFVETDDDDDVFTSQDSAQKSGGGPNVFMRETLNFIDFYEQNFKVLGFNMRESSTSIVKADDANSLPVRATGILPERDLIDLFKHFVITRLSEKDEKLRARYIANENMFAEALGLSKENQIKVKESLAYTVHKRVFKNILQYKDGLSPQDIQQFAVLKDSLGLSAEFADRVYYEASKGAVIEYAKQLFTPSGESTPPITPEAAQKFRNQVRAIETRVVDDK